MGPPDKEEGENFQADGGFLILLLLLLGIFIGDEIHRWLCVGGLGVAHPGFPGGSLSPRLSLAACGILGYPLLTVFGLRFSHLLDSAPTLLCQDLGIWEWTY